MGSGFGPTEWIDGNVINLGNLPGVLIGSIPTSINDAGQIVGVSEVLSQVDTEATEWIDGNVIGLSGLPGSAGSDAEGINDDGQVVGSSLGVNGFFLEATEWSGDNVIALGGLPDPNKPMLVASITLDRRWDTASSFHRPRPLPLSPNLPRGR